MYIYFCANPKAENSIFLDYIRESGIGSTKRFYLLIKGQIGYKCLQGNSIRAYWRCFIWVRIIMPVHRKTRVPGIEKKDGGDDIWKGWQNSGPLNRLRWARAANTEALKSAAPAAPGNNVHPETICKSKEKFQ